jgi:hypothetical protein
MATVHDAMTMHDLSLLPDARRDSRLEPAILGETTEFVKRQIPLRRRLPDKTHRAGRPVKGNANATPPWPEHDIFSTRGPVIWPMHRSPAGMPSPSNLEAHVQDIRVIVTVEVDQVANGLAIRKPVPLQVVRNRSRKWYAQCESPPFETAPCDAMEDAIVAGARQAHTELQIAIDERPVIIGRITPDDVPRGRF